MDGVCVPGTSTLVDLRSASGASTQLTTKAADQIGIGGQAWAKPCCQSALREGDVATAVKQDWDERDLAVHQHCAHAVAEIVG